MGNRLKLPLWIFLTRNKSLSCNYFLSPTAINQLRDHKKWSLAKFGHSVTKKYFQDIDKGFKYIAENHRIFPARLELTGESGLSIYPIREHYIVYIHINNSIHIVAILRQAQDIPHIINEGAAIFQRELAQYKGRA